MKEAETLCQKSIDLEKKIYGENHPGLATKFNNLGEIYRKSWKLKEAETYFFKSIDLEKKCYG